jgi:hypothetical protein
MSSYTLKGLDGAAMQGRLSREDRISRNGWTNNVTRGDHARDVAYRRKRIMKLYPELDLETVEYYLERELRGVRR